ncbi:MAG: transketolase [Planctomycetes bacterium]|nr:transketolase [Planctomycetota bacterium]
MELVKRPHARNLVRWAAGRPEVLVLSADLTSSCEADDFRDTYPERFFSLGMAEQNMMGFAAGLAREGFFPYVHTFAVFICRRPFDQVAMSIGYSNLPVRLIGFLPGVTTPGGATHQAIDDVGLMRLIPNMTVLECGDATEVESVLDVAQSVDGPVYVRMLRGEVPRLFDPAERMRLQTARVVRRGADVAVLSSGICTEEAMRATGPLEERGVSVHHLHVSTLKPFDDPVLVDALSTARLGVITMENHNTIGGHGSAVAEVMAETGLAKRLIRLGIKDQYSHGASRPYLLRECGLDAAALVRAVEQLTGETLGLSEEDLAAVRIDPVQTTAKPEDL